LSEEGMDMVFVREGADEPAQTDKAQMTVEEFVKPVGNEGMSFFGVWKLKTVMNIDAASLGMSMEVTLKRSGVSIIVDGDEKRYGAWYVENGVAMVDGVPVTIVDGYKLSMPHGAAQMIFSRISEVPYNTDLTDEERQAIQAMIDEQAKSSFAYADVTLVLTKAETIFNGVSYPVDASAFGEYSVRFNSDGSADLVQSGLVLPAEYLTWSVNDQGKYVIDYSVEGTHVMEYVFSLTDIGITMDYYGTLMTFSPAE